MSKLSMGVTLVLKSFHKTGFESIDFRRRFGIDAGPSTYNCSYAQTRVECDEGFARSWFGNALWDAADIDPAWLTPGELVVNDKSPDQVRIVPEMSPQRVQELYVRARLAMVEGERDEMALSINKSLEERSQALFDNEQLKAEVKSLRKQVSAHVVQYNEVVAVANRNERLAQEAEEQLRKLQAEHEIACKDLDKFKELVEAQHDLIEGQENKIAEQYELRRRYEQLRREYDAECIRVDQQEARVNRVEAGLQALIQECTQSPHVGRSSA